MKSRILILVLVVLAAAIVSVVLYNTKTINDIESDVVTIKETTANKNVNEAVDCEEGDGRVYFQIEEIGIEFLVDKDIKDDLIYFYDNERKSFDGAKLEVAYFSTKSLLNLDKGCTAEEGPVVAISKSKGIAQESSYYKNRINEIKQFDGYFISYSGSEYSGSPSFCYTEEENMQKVIDQTVNIRKKIYIQDLECIRELDKNKAF